MQATTASESGPIAYVSSQPANDYFIDLLTSAVERGNIKKRWEKWHWLDEAEENGELEKKQKRNKD